MKALTALVVPLVELPTSELVVNRMVDSVIALVLREALVAPAGKLPAREPAIYYVVKALTILVRPNT